MSRRRVAKVVNEAKGRLKKRAGPVEKSQEAAPIGDAIEDYWRRGTLSFSIPAHCGGRGPNPEFTRWAGADAARADLPMSHGLDTR
ncbi:MAG: hypothetical protein ACJ766_11565, partial [Thermoleophilaceae bacterium]